MSDYIFALIIPLVAIAIIFAWVPFLNLICPPRARSLGRGFQGEELKARSSIGPIRDEMSRLKNDALGHM
jgi:hypothetical protein